MTPQLQNATPGEKTTMGQPLGMSDLVTHFTLVEPFQPHSHLYFDAMTIIETVSNIVTLPLAFIFFKPYLSDQSKGVGQRDLT